MDALWQGSWAHSQCFPKNCLKKSELQGGQETPFSKMADLSRFSIIIRHTLLIMLLQMSFLGSLTYFMIWIIFQHNFCFVTKTIFQDGGQDGDCLMQCSYLGSYNGYEMYEIKFGVYNYVFTVMEFSCRT